LIQTNNEQLHHSSQPGPPPSQNPAPFGQGHQQPQFTPNAIIPPWRLKPIVLGEPPPPPPFPANQPWTASPAYHAQARSDVPFIRKDPANYLDNLSAGHWKLPVSWGIAKSQIELDSVELPIGHIAPYGQPYLHVLGFNYNRWGVKNTSHNYDAKYNWNYKHSLVVETMAEQESLMRKTKENVDAWLYSRGLEHVTRFLCMHTEAGILEYAILHERSSSLCPVATFHMTFPEVLANNIRRGKLRASKTSEESGNENRADKPLVFFAKKADWLLEPQQGYFYATNMLEDGLFHTFLFQTMVPHEDDGKNKSKSWERLNCEDRVELNRSLVQFQTQFDCYLWFSCHVSLL
jgi:hypothetical protein